MSKQTKARIIEAAEYLFALQGYRQTSMREITARADVNLASVNYHFGSKKNLIQAVLKRYFDVMMPQIDEALAKLVPSVGRKGVDQVLQNLKGPLLNLNAVQPDGTEMFVQLLGKGYTESQGHLRRFIMGSYGETVKPYWPCCVPHYRQSRPTNYSGACTLLLAVLCFPWHRARR